jgi:hypothetical protein
MFGSGGSVVVVVGALVVVVGALVVVVGSTVVVGATVVVVVLEVVVGSAVVVVGSTVVVVVLEVVVGPAVVVVVGGWQLSSVTAVVVPAGAGPNITVDVPTTVPSPVPTSWPSLLYHSTVPPRAVDPDGHATEKLCPALTLIGLGGFAPAEGRTNPTATAVATSAKTMTRGRMRAPSLGCIATALTRSASPAEGLVAPSPLLLRSRSDDEPVAGLSEGPLRLAALMPVATPTPLAPLPAERLNANQQQAGQPRRDHDEPLHRHFLGSAANRAILVTAKEQVNHEEGVVAHQTGRVQALRLTSHPAGRGDASVGMATTATEPHARGRGWSPICRPVVRQTGPKRHIAERHLGHVWGVDEGTRDNSGIERSIVI